MGWGTGCVTIVRTRIPIRLRLTLAFAVGAALVLTAASATEYARMNAQMLDATDAALGARADALEAALVSAGTMLERPGQGLDLSEDEFAQVTSASGVVLRSTAAVAGLTVLDPATLRSVSGRTYFERRVPAMDDVVRILVDPLPGGLRLVLGISLGDRADALLQLLVVLSVGDPLALTLTSLGFWLVAGLLLRPGHRTEAAEAEAVTAARQLVDDASHELRIPLATLKAELDLALRRDRSPSELRDTIRRAAAETDRVVRLAHDLLVLSRANRGALPIRRRSLSLQELLRDARDRHLARANAGGVAIEVGAHPVSALLDPERVSQVLDNLLDNALTHTPSGGRIEVGASRESGFVTVTVDDSGPGFPPDLGDRAFEPFVRGASQVWREDEGAGMGLAIVRALASSHGGSASAHNRPEGGARVVVRLSEH